MTKLKNKIVIGTWSLSGDLGKVEVKNVHEMINLCVKNDFKEFDIAPTYGFGVIDKIFSNYRNSSLKINTKFGYDLDRKKNFSLKILKKSIENSYNYHGKLNAIFLHNPRTEIKNWEKIILYMNELKNQKVVKYTGISLARDFYFSEKILNQFDIIQDEINFLRLSPLMFKKNKFSLMARSPLATGILSNNFNKKSKYDKIDYRSNWLKGKRKINIIEQKKKLIKIFGNNLKNSAYSFLINNSNVNKIIIGIKKKAHVKNLKNLNNLEKLSELKLRKLISLHKENFALKDKHLY